MNKRIRKKKIKRLANWFTKTKIPLMFTSEKEREKFVSAFSREQVNQKHSYPKL